MGNTIGSVALAVSVLLAASIPSADAGTVYVGPFACEAFATNAQQLDAGTVAFSGGATTLNEALAGYTPTTDVTNIGYMGAANHFQLDFGRPAHNVDGPDIAFFDADLHGKFKIQDHYEIAVRPKGGAFTDYRFYSEWEFEDTGVPAIPGITTLTLYGVGIDLSDFGLPPCYDVDAMRFRALAGSEAHKYSSGMPQGDPVMAGVLNPAPDVEPFKTLHTDPPPFDIEKLDPKMQAALGCFEIGVAALWQELKIEGGEFKPESGYRPQSYQDHFYEIYEKFKELADVDGIEKDKVGNYPQLKITGDLCQCYKDLVDQVNEEILEKHKIRANTETGNPAVNKYSSHTKGTAVDISVDLLRLPPDKIKALANQCGLVQKPTDQVHFEYVGALNDNYFDWVPLDEAWTVAGLGSAEAVEYPPGSDNFAAELTAGSPVVLSQHFDTADDPFLLDYDYLFRSSEGSLEVSINSILIDSISPPDDPGEDLITRSILIDDPSLLGLELAELAFRFDGPAGSSMLLDNIDTRPIPEPSCALLAAAGLLGLGLYACRRRRMSCHTASPGRPCCLPADQGHSGK